MKIEREVSIDIYLEMKCYTCGYEIDWHDSRDQIIKIEPCIKCNKKSFEEDMRVAKQEIIESKKETTR